jgi:hypothetical protein
MINMFLYIVLAVFVAGMMVGRTPEYLNRRVEMREVRLAVLAMFAHALLHPRGHAPVRGDDVGQPTRSQHRRARLQRDPVRVQLVGGQQRLGLRGPRRQHAAVERRDRLW